MNNTNSQNEVGRLAYELTYHRYLMSQDKAGHLFTVLTSREYIALRRIAKSASDGRSEDGKTYLSELSETMELSIHSVSKMIRALKDKGLVYWSHDGDGSDGTYVIITPGGKNAMQKQEDILKDYYSRVIERFGRDHLVSLFEELAKLEAVMHETIAEEDTDDDTAE